MLCGCFALRKQNGANLGAILLGSERLLNHKSEYLIFVMQGRRKPSTVGPNEADVNRTRCDDLFSCLPPFTPQQNGGQHGAIFIENSFWNMKDCFSDQTLTSFPEPSRLTSSTSSAVPSISAVKWSMWAMGFVPIVCGKNKKTYYFIEALFNNEYIKNKLKKMYASLDVWKQS